MNEEIIKIMSDWFRNVPKPKESLYKEMWSEVEKQVLNRLSKQPKDNVLDWLKSNINDDPRNGPKWLSNVSQQTHCKLRGTK